MHPTLQPTPLEPTTPITFIGGGNMAAAIIGGLIRAGHQAQAITVIEPVAAVRHSLSAQCGVRCWDSAALHDPSAAADCTAALAASALIVWAVKPQVFQAAAAPVADALQAAAPSACPLHLSVAAGIPTAALAQWLRSQRIVRAMPNTPALIGRGTMGLFATAAVDEAARALAAAALASTGELVWVSEERLIDAVTAISGSGPAYVFYLLDALTQAGQQLGLDVVTARTLACSTFEGAAALAAASAEDLATLRQRVTSPGGTTAAALAVLERKQVAQHMSAAALAAAARAEELGREFGNL